MIHAAPQGLFSWNFDLEPEGGGLIPVTFNWLGEAGGFKIEGVEFRIEKQGTFSGQFELFALGRTLAEAQKAGAFSRVIHVNVDALDYVLEPRSIFGRAFDVRLDGAFLGAVSPLGMFSRKAEIDLPDDMPLPIQVFLFWLTVAMWRRQAKSDS